MTVEKLIEKLNEVKEKDEYIIIINGVSYFGGIQKISIDDKAKEVNISIDF